MSRDRQPDGRTVVVHAELVGDLALFLVGEVTVQLLGHVGEGVEEAFLRLTRRERRVILPARLFVKEDGHDVRARMVMHFGAVDYRAVVWVNGELVTRHEGGHTPFSADITRVVREHDNEVVVRAEDPLDDASLPRGKQRSTELHGPWHYATTTGIWQTVWLEPLPRRAVELLRMKPDYDAREVEFDIGAEGQKHVIVTFDGRPVGEWSGDGTKGRIALSEIHEWSPEDPNLYVLQARYESDHVASYFGLRKVETKDGRFMLNGRPYVQRLILDQGYFPGGLLTAASDADLRRDIELAKAMGFNGARKHQKIEDPRWHH